MSKVLNINAVDFEKEVTNSSLPVLVDFWAPWCKPCQMMGPVLDTLSLELDGVARIIKIDVEKSDNNDLANMFQIRSIPSMKIFFHGKVVNEFIGMRSGAELKEALLAVK